MADVLTDAGEAWIIDLIDASAANYIGWGVGAGTAVKSDTNLFTPTTEARVVATRSQPTADTIRWVATITSDGTKTITNAGVWAAAGSGSPPSGGTPLIVKGDFASQALSVNDRIEFTVNLTIL